MICQQPFGPDCQEMYLAIDVIAVENELERILIGVVAVAMPRVLSRLSSSERRSTISSALNSLRVSLTQSPSHEQEQRC